MDCDVWRVRKESATSGDCVAWRGGWEKPYPPTRDAPMAWSRTLGDVAGMPIISTFFGINVRMYFADLGPPHIHVDYHGQEALVAIIDGGILHGRLPRCAHALVREWCLDHLLELELNWLEAQALRWLARIPGADND